MNTYLIDLPEIDGPVFSPFIIKNGKITNYNNLDGVECYDNLDDITRYIDTSHLPETYMVNLDEYLGHGITSLHIIELVKQGYIPYSINLYNWYNNAGTYSKGLNDSPPTSLVFCYYDDTPRGYNKPYVYFAPIYPSSNYYSDNDVQAQKNSKVAGTPDHLVPPFLKAVALFGIDSEGNIFVSFGESTTK